MKDTISLDEAFAQIDARRKIENPWHEEDEARVEEKRVAAHARYEKWVAANPQSNDDEDEDDEEEQKNEN